MVVFTGQSTTAPVWSLNSLDNDDWTFPPLSQPSVLSSILWNLWDTVLVGSPQHCPLFALVAAVPVVECPPELGLVTPVSGVF